MEQNIENLLNKTSACIWMSGQDPVQHHSDQYTTHVKVKTRKFHFLLDLSIYPYTSSLHQFLTSYLDFSRS